MAVPLRGAVKGAGVPSACTLLRWTGRGAPSLVSASWPTLSLLCRLHSRGRRSTSARFPARCACSAQHTPVSGCRNCPKVAVQMLEDIQRT